MFRREDPLPLDPLGPIGIGPVENAYAPANALALDPLSPMSTSERHDMTTTDRPPHAMHQHDQRSPSEKIEEIASEVDLAAGGALRAVEVAAVVLLGLLICPPLMILVVVVVVPLLVTALVLGLIAAVLSTPYLLVHHLRGHHGGHAFLLAQRLRRAGRALFDLAPHRIVADARKVDPGR